MRTSVSGLNDNDAARYPIVFSLNVDEDITSITWNEAHENSYPYICNCSVRAGKRRRGYVSQLEGCLGFDFKIPTLDFLSALTNGRVDIFGLGALVGTDALDELCEALLKHPRP